MILFQEVVSSAFRIVYDRRDTLVRALSWPLGGLILIGLFELTKLGAILSFFTGVLSLVIQVIFAITTHRIVLLGEDSVSKWGITAWTTRETYFLLHIIGLALMCIPPSMLIMFFPGNVLATIVVALLVCWIFSRFSLVFPGIAVDKGITFQLSWQLSQNYQLLMFLVVILFPLLLAIPIILLSFIPYSNFLVSIFSAIILVFEVAALSVAYKLITSEVYERDDLN